MDGNRLDPKNDKVQYEPVCIFHENKPRSAFLRNPKKLAFYVDGATRALKFGKTTDDLQPYWTRKEATELVKKEIAEAHAKFQPIKTWQFIIILIFLFVIIGLCYRIATSIGALQF